MVTRSLCTLHVVFALAICFSDDTAENEMVHFEISGFPIRKYQSLPLHCTVNSTSNDAIDVKQGNTMKVRITEGCMIQLNHTDIRASCVRQRNRTIIDLLIPRFTSSYTGTWTCQQEEEKQDIRLNYDYATWSWQSGTVHKTHINGNITFELFILGDPLYHLINSDLDLVVYLHTSHFHMYREFREAAVVSSDYDSVVNITVHATSASLAGPYYWHSLDFSFYSDSFLLIVTDIPNQPVVTFETQAVDYGHSIKAYCDTEVRTRPKYKAKTLVYHWFLNDLNITNTGVLYSQEDEVLKIHHAGCGLVGAHLTCTAREGDLLSNTSDSVLVTTSFTCWLHVINADTTIVKENIDERTYLLSVEANTFPAPSFTWIQNSDQGVSVASEVEPVETSTHTYVSQRTVVANAHIGYTVIVRNEVDEAVVRFELNNDPTTGWLMVRNTSVLKSDAITTKYTLTVKADAYPKPSFTWMRKAADDVQIVETEKDIIEMSRFIYTSQLAVIAKDSGKYSVVIQNEVNKTVVQFDVATDSPGRLAATNDASFTAGGVAGVAIGMFVVGVVAVLLLLVLLKKYRNKQASKENSNAQDERTGMQLSSISASVPSTDERYEQLTIGTIHNRGQANNLPTETYDEIQVNRTPRKCRRNKKQKEENIYENEKI